jgi:hypothetical protein
MFSLSDIIDNIRNMGVLNEQRRRDDRRREQQGSLEGFKHSGRPMPVPTYRGPPAPGAVKTGITTETVVGDGGIVIANINHQGGTTWVYHLVYAVVGGNISTMDKDHWVYAMEGDDFIAVVAVSEHVASPAAAHVDTNYARIPTTGLRLAIRASTIGADYHITGVWEEDR